MEVINIVNLQIVNMFRPHQIPSPMGWRDLFVLSFVSQCYHGINLSGALRGNVAGQQAREHQHERDSNERQRVDSN